MSTGESQQRHAESGRQRPTRPPPERYCISTPTSHSSLLFLHPTHTHFYPKGYRLPFIPSTPIPLSSNPPINPNHHHTQHPPHPQSPGCTTTSPHYSPHTHRPSCPPPIQCPHPTPTHTSGARPRRANTAAQNARGVQARPHVTPASPSVSARRATCVRRPVPGGEYQCPRMCFLLCILLSASRSVLGTAEPHPSVASRPPPPHSTVHCGRCFITDSQNAGLDTHVRYSGNPLHCS